MKYAKMLGLLVVAATAFMAFAATASATQVTAPSGTLYTGNIKAVNEGAISLKGTAFWNCKNSLIEGAIQTHGVAVTASGNVSLLTFTVCDQHVSVKVNGTLEFHATSGGNGTVTSNGATVTEEATTIFGNIHCNYETKSTDVGEFTGATSPTGHATLHIKNNKLPVEAGSVFLCGSYAELNGAYKFTTPTGLRLD